MTALHRNRRAARMKALKYSPPRVLLWVRMRTTMGDTRQMMRPTYARERARRLRQIATGILRP